MNLKNALLPWRRRPGILKRGARLDRYEIVELIASGGFGDVYRGVDLRIQRPVAIKVLRPEHLNDDRLRASFVREARLLARVDNEHVVKVFDTGQQEGMAFLVMELVEGDTLARHMSNEEPLPIADALFIAAKIASGVAAAHDAGILHRDLKPDNVLITPDLRVKVGDFGTAKVQSEAQSDKHTGTLAYMSPEHFERKAILDQRVDIRSMGLILYLMLSGKQAYTRPPGMQLPQFMLRVATQLPPDPAQYARYLVEYDYVLNIVWKAIHPDRSQRHATAHELETECLEAKARLHREASPERAARLAQIDVRAPFLVADTAPLLMIRPPGSLPAVSEPTTNLPSPSLKSPTRHEKQPLTPAALLTRATAVLGTLALSATLGLVLKGSVTPSLTAPVVATRPYAPAVRPVSTASAKSGRALPTPTVTSAASAPPLLAPASTPVTRPAPKPQLESKHAAPRPTTRSAPSALPAPPSGSPISMTDGCKPGTYRCAIY